MIVPQPTLVSQVESREFELRGKHPAYPLEYEQKDEPSSQGPDFGRLIHNPVVAERELSEKPPLFLPTLPGAKSEEAAHASSGVQVLEATV